MCEDERDGLGMLVLQLGDELAWVGLAQELKRDLRDRCSEALQDFFGLRSSEAVFEQLPSVFDAAPRT